MRKLIPILFGFGGFLLIAGLVATFYAPGAVKKTPLDVNTTTHLSGKAAKLDTATGAFVTKPIKAVSITKTDSKNSNGSTVLWTNVNCVVIDTNNPPACVDGKDPRLLTASTDVFATSRTTGLATSSPNLPADAVPHVGLVNKWPFDSEKKTYPYWSGTLGKAVDAKFDRTAKVNGLETYVYKTVAKAAPIQIADGVKGTYDDVTEIYVEPKTGAIVNQTDNQQRALANGTKVLDLQIAFTDKQIKTSVNDAHANIDKLTLITKTVPIVGIIGGILVILGALLLTRSKKAKVDTKD